MQNRIRLMRLHMTEAAAIASVHQDYAAFLTEFASVVESASTYILKERYADFGFIGCIVEIKLTQWVETPVLLAIENWLKMLNRANQVEMEHQKVSMNWRESDHAN